MSGSLAICSRLMVASHIGIFFSSKNRIWGLSQWPQKRISHLEAFGTANSMLDSLLWIYGISIEGVPSLCLIAIVPSLGMLRFAEVGEATPAPHGAGLSKVV